MTPERRAEIDRYINSNSDAAWVIPMPWDDMIRELLAEVERLNGIIECRATSTGDVVYRTTGYRRDAMSERGRKGAVAQHAKHDPKVTTAKARETFNRRFEDEVDPDRVMTEEERTTAVAVARKAYYHQLSVKSGQARRERAAQKRTPSLT